MERSPYLFAGRLRYVTGILVTFCCCSGTVHGWGEDGLRNDPTGGLQFDTRQQRWIADSALAVEPSGMSQSRRKTWWALSLTTLAKRLATVRRVSELPSGTRSLGGLVRFRYVLSTPDSKDVWLVGWKWHQQGDRRSTSVDRLADLIGLLSADESRAVSCSIAPSRGMQVTTFRSIRPDGHAARTLLVGDVRLKQLALGVGPRNPLLGHIGEKAQGLFEPGRPGRIWLELTTKPARSAPSGRTQRVGELQVRVRSERPPNPPTGRDPVEGWTARVEQVWPQLVRGEPALRELAALANLHATATLVHRTSPDRVVATLVRSARGKADRWVVPRRWRGWSRTFPLPSNRRAVISGGVVLLRPRGGEPLDTAVAEQIYELVRDAKTDDWLWEVASPLLQGDDDAETDLPAVTQPDEARPRTPVSSPAPYYNPAARFYGIPVRERRVLFVVDRSHSMNVRAGTVPASRLVVARRELAGAINALERGTYFNVACFDARVRRWSPRAQPATPANQRSALRFVGQMNTGWGTNTLAALRDAVTSRRDTMQRISSPTAAPPLELCKSQLKSWPWWSAGIASSR